MSNLRFTSAIIKLFLALILPLSGFANSDGFWLEDGSDRDAAFNTPLDRLNERSGVLPLSGGAFWHVLEFEKSADPLVVDFQSSSVIGMFTHYILDSDGHIVQTLSGGIQSSEVNPYFLRHARDVDVNSGRYRLVTQMTSPFLLAQPKPRVFEQTSYIQSIKLGNAITLLGLGVFISLGIYYVILGVTRRQPTDFFYAIFILGNLTYNSTALNVLSDVFQWPVFYTIGFPIMASNLAYIAFVMALLGITKRRALKLRILGLACIGLLASFWLIVPFVPNMSLEFARYGVGLFAIYGITCGIAMAVKGQKIARYYLVANIAFVIPGIMSISLQSLPNNTMYIEHLGLFAVALEVILLSLVLSYQLSIVYKEKSANLLAAQEALTVADNAVKAKERFLANISHELRTPLNAIQGSIDLLSYKVSGKDTTEHIEVIRHSSAFLLFLINDILDLAKLNADMLVIERRPFHLKEMVTQICSIYGSSFTVNSRAQFKLEIEQNVPEHIVGDEKRIEQVIANLLSNAFKFTDQGTVTFTLGIIDDNQLKFSVQDSGIGIEPDNLTSMFSAFTQADSSISRKYGGTGLGLRIASRIVELMGGKISAESTPGQGSNFWFTIPLEVADGAEPSKTETDTEQNEGDEFKNLSIMVVDDNLVNLKVIKAMLKKLDVKVADFSNATDGIKHAMENPIDLIVMDVQMPDVDGLAASKALRDSGFNNPIIAFTANASENDQVLCFEAGMNDILIKPINLKNLTMILRKWAKRIDKTT